MGAIAEHWCEEREEQRVAGAETYVDAGGARIRYKLLGADKSASPVVFINGLAAGVEQWDEVQRRVAAFAPALTYDRGGSGFSHHSSAHDGVGQAEELAALLDALHIAKPVVLAGYSGGGPIARIFASRHPGRVAGLLLLEPRVAEIRELLPNRRGPFRRYVRPLTRDTLSTLFGIRRLLNWLGRSAPRMPVEERADAILRRFWHWWAVDLERFAAADLDAQAIAAGPVGRIPAIIYTNEKDPSDRGAQLYLQLLHVLAGTSTHGEVRMFAKQIEHGELLTNPMSQKALVDGIRELSGR